MTVTGTQTWHELAERNRELEEAIQRALAQYGEGRRIDPIFRDLKEVV